MRCLASLCTLCCFIGFQTAVFADGLVYQLPADGTSIEYELEMSMKMGDSAQEMNGTLTISSVGTETVDDKPCRWIEIKMTMNRNGQDRTVYGKALIPEAELAQGKSPMANFKKAWFLRQGGQPAEITDLESRNAGPMPAFLCGPLDDAKDLAAETVKTGLGELSCKGVSGTTKFSQGSEEQTWTFNSRLHEKAPFGLVSTEIKMKMIRDGQPSGEGTLKMTAKKVGKDAKSEVEAGL